MRSIPRRATRSGRGHRGPNLTWLVDLAVEIHCALDRESKLMQHRESVPARRTVWVTGCGRVCAALVVTSRSFDSWRTRRVPRDTLERPTAPRRHWRLAAAADQYMNSDRATGNQPHAPFRPPRSARPVCAAHHNTPSLHLPEWCTNF